LPLGLQLVESTIQREPLLADKERGLTFFVKPKDSKNVEYLSPDELLEAAMRSTVVVRDSAGKEFIASMPLVGRSSQDNKVRPIGLWQGTDQKPREGVGDEYDESNQAAVDETLKLTGTQANLLVKQGRALGALKFHKEGVHKLSSAEIAFLNTQIKAIQVLLAANKVKKALALGDLEQVAKSGHGRHLIEEDNPVDQVLDKVTEGISKVIPSLGGVDQTLKKGQVAYLEGNRNQAAKVVPVDPEIAVAIEGDQGGGAGSKTKIRIPNRGLGHLPLVAGGLVVVGVITACAWGDKITALFSGKEVNEADIEVIANSDSIQGDPTEQGSQTIPTPSVQVVESDNAGFENTGDVEVSVPKITGLEVFSSAKGISRQDLLNLGVDKEALRTHELHLKGRAWREAHLEDIVPSEQSTVDKWFNSEASGYEFYYQEIDGSYVVMLKHDGVLSLVQYIDEETGEFTTITFMPNIEWTMDRFRLVPITDLRGFEDGVIDSGVTSMISGGAYGSNFQLIASLNEEGEIISIWDPFVGDAVELVVTGVDDEAVVGSDDEVVTEPEVPVFPQWEGSVWKLTELTEVDNPQLMEGGFLAFDNGAEMRWIEIKNTTGIDDMSLELTEYGYMVVGEKDGNKVAYDPLNEVFLPMLTEEYSNLYEVANNAVESLVEAEIFYSLEDLETNGIIDWTKMDVSKGGIPHYAYGPWAMGEGQDGPNSSGQRCKLNLFRGGSFRLYLEDGRYVQMDRYIYNENASSDDVKAQEIFSGIAGAYKGFSNPLVSLSWGSGGQWVAVPDLVERFPVGSYTRFTLLIKYDLFTARRDNGVEYLWEAIINEQTIEALSVDRFVFEISGSHKILQIPFVLYTQTYETNPGVGR